MLADARAELGHVLEAQVELGRMAALADGADTAYDLLAGLGPLAASIGVAAALPGAASVAGTAFFGLVATSAVSAPILLGGLALAGAGFATGAINTRNIRFKRIARMRDRIEAHVNETVLSTAHPRSLASRLIAALGAAAERAMHAD